MYFFKSPATDDKEQMVGHLEVGDQDSVKEGECDRVSSGHDSLGADPMLFSLYHARV